MTPTTQPKSHNPSTVLCWISIAVVTISLVVKGWQPPKTNHLFMVFISPSSSEVQLQMIVDVQ